MRQESQKTEAFFLPVPAHRHRLLAGSRSWLWAFLLRRGCAAAPMEAAAATSNPALIGHFDSVSAQTGQLSPDSWVADTRTPGQSIDVEHSIAIGTKTHRGCVR
jgi:hypothetical protein